MQTCPRCGTSNGPLVRYCMTCGTPLSTVQAPAHPSMGYTPPTGQFYPSQYPANYWEVARTGKINNTLTGLLLLVVGVLIAWIPFAGFIGGIVGFIGAILVLVGREPFGTEHVRNTTLAIIFFVVGIAVTVFGFFYALVYTAGSYYNGPTSLLTLFSLVFVIGGAIVGLSEVLLTYSLQRVVGHQLLWIAYGVSIFLSVVNVLVGPFSGGVTSALFFGSGVFLFTGVLAAVPAAIYGTAFYLARERIVRQEIPPPLSQQDPGKAPW